MPGKYPNRIKSLPLFDGRFDAYKLEAKNSDVLFASYPAGTLIPSHSHQTENHGVVTRGELILTCDNKTSRYNLGAWYSIPANKSHSAKFEMDTDIIEFWFDKDSK
ncbi:cupin [bacterium K02(2017)]|nr:cupin [bacterium K02(2017)]